jgi:hypothetical protein
LHLCVSRLYFKNYWLVRTVSSVGKVGRVSVINLVASQQLTRSHLPGNGRTIRCLCTFVKIELQKGKCVSCECVSRIISNHDIMSFKLYAYLFLAWPTVALLFSFLGDKSPIRRVSRISRVSRVKGLAGFKNVLGPFALLLFCRLMVVRPSLSKRLSNQTCIAIMN